MMQGTTKICPNLFVILMAKSSGRKAHPVNVCTSLVKKSKHTKVIAGRSSIEAILDTLSLQETEKGTGKVITGGSCILCAPELMSFFVSSESLVPILTDMYDHRDEWDSKLRGMGGNFKVKDMCVSLFAAANETSMRSIYQGVALQGGLLGRTFLVSADEERPPNDLLDGIHYDFNVFNDEIEVIKKLKGPIQIDTDAKELYRSWYRSWFYSSKKKGDQTGILGRTHTNVIKVGMILGVADEYAPVIKKRHFEESIERCTGILGNYEIFVMGTGKSSINEAGSIILQDLWEAPGHKMSRTDILASHWGQFDAEILDKLIATFEQGKLITALHSGVISEYVMTQKCIDIFERQHGKKGLVQ